MIAAGKLDRRITLQRATSSQDEAGQSIPAWSKVAEVWAQVLPLAAREPFQADQRAAWVDTKFVIRYRADVGPLDRVLYGGRTYDVVGVQEIGRREGLELLAYARAE